MSEWLEKFDATTTLDDVLTRPSSFNPYPEHADGGLEVWAISNPTANPLYTVRYPKIDAGCRVTLPIIYEEPAGEQTPPELLEGSALNGGFQGAAVADLDKWIPISNFWNGLSADMASTYVAGQGYEAGAGDKIGALMVANAMPHEDSTHSISPEPRAFVRQAISTMHQEIEEGRPEVAFAITKDLFLGFTGERNGQRVSNVGTLEWVTKGLPYTLFPNFVKSWERELNPHMISTVAHPFEIGNSAAHVINSNLSALALNAWVKDQAPEHPDAVVEKVIGLQKRMTDSAMIAEAILGVKLDEASRRFYEAMTDDQGYLSWEIPRPLGEYVMGVVSSAD